MVSHEELRERLGCYLQILVWLSFVIPSVSTPWLLLWKVGPISSMLGAIAIVAAWILIGGMPAPASGNKAVSCGLTLLFYSFVPAILVDLVILVVRLF